MIGEVRMFAGNFAPRTWALAQGQLLPISQYTALFSLIGTTYGGDGVTTFALPDFRGRSPVGTGHGPGLSDIRLGQLGGAESVTLTVAQMPSHTHTADVSVAATLKANSGAGNSDNPTGNVLAKKSRTKNYSSSAPNVDMAAEAIETTVTASNGSTGGNQAFSIRNPYLGINFIICLDGVFPSRS